MTGDVKVLAIPAKIFFRQAGSLCHVFLQVIRLPRQIAFQSEAPPRFQFPVPHNMEPAFLFVIREDFIPDGQREPSVFPDETGRFFDFVNVITENLISKLRVPVQQKDESDSPVPEVLNMFMRDMPPVSKNRNANIIIPRDFSASLLPRVRLF